MSISNTYDQLDKLIINRVSHEACTFTNLYGNSAVRSMAEDLAKPDLYGRKAGDRVIDRRLQALRKSGRILYSKGRWHLTPATAGAAQ